MRTCAYTSVIVMCVNVCSYMYMETMPCIVCVVYIYRVLLSYKILACAYKLNDCMVANDSHPAVHSRAAPEDC